MNRRALQDESPAFPTVAPSAFHLRRSVLAMEMLASSFSFADWLLSAISLAPVSPLVFSSAFPSRLSLA
jgi:hypothetical protein